MRNILFVCVHNAGRSQMAQSFVETLAKGIVTSQSAGTVPSEGIDATVVEAMREKGIDISNSKPKLLTQEMLGLADQIITMGCSVEEACPWLFLSGPLEDWGLDDPMGNSLDQVRRIRDEIEEKVKALLATSS